VCVCVCVCVCMCEGVMITASEDISVGMMTIQLPTYIDFRVVSTLL